MTIYKAGDIVTIPFPYVEGKNNIKGDIVIDDVNDCGLIVPSIIRCSRIATLDQNMIISKVGKIPAEFSKLASEAIKGFIKL